MNRAGKYEHRFLRDGIEMPIHCHTVEFFTSKVIANAHYHDYIELLYCIDGCASAVIGGREYTFTKADLVIVNANEVHSIASGDGGCKYHVIKFMPKLLKTDDFSVLGTKYLLPFLENSVNHPRVIRFENDEWSKRCEKLVADAMAEWVRGEYGYELSIQGSIISLFVIVLRHWQESNPNALKSNVTPTKKLITSVEKVMKLSEKRFYDMTEEEAADIAGLSYSYFSRTFRRLVGMSFTAYIDTLKIKEGERLLVTTEMSVTEIGQTVGFSTTSYFISRFKHHHGISPQKFRTFYAKKQDVI